MTRERTPLPPRTKPKPPARLYLLVCKDDGRIDLAKVQTTEPGALTCDDVYEYVLVARVVK
jgi:hypothetical protein